MLVSPVTCRLITSHFLTGGGGGIFFAASDANLVRLPSIPQLGSVLTQKHIYFRQNRAKYGSEIGSSPFDFVCTPTQATLMPGATFSFVCTLRAIYPEAYSVSPTPVSMLSSYPLQAVCQGCDAEVILFITSFCCSVFVFCFFLKKKITCSPQLTSVESLALRGQCSFSVPTTASASATATVTVTSPSFERQFSQVLTLSITPCAPGYGYEPPQGCVKCPSG